MNYNHLLNSIYTNLFGKFIWLSPATFEPFRNRDHAPKFTCVQVKHTWFHRALFRFQESDLSLAVTEKLFSRISNTFCNTVSFLKEIKFLSILLTVIKEHHHMSRNKGIKSKSLTTFIHMKIYPLLTTSTLENIRSNISLSAYLRKFNTCSQC